MNSFSKNIAIAYGFGLVIFWSGLGAGYLLRPDQEKSEKTAIVRKSESNRLENIHDVIQQKVETTYHNYTVILYEGKVVDKGIIHHANCKCKSK